MNARCTTVWATHIETINVFEYMFSLSCAKKVLDVSNWAKTVAEMFQQMCLFNAVFKVFCSAIWSTTHILRGFSLNKIVEINRTKTQRNKTI